MANPPRPSSPPASGHVVPRGPVAILWDIENCAVPSEVPAEEVAGNIRVALRAHSEAGGAVTVFSAYGDFNSFPRRLREAFQRTGIKLVDVPNGRKDAADKAILVDMFLFALDNPPPSSIMLISGDGDFAPSLHILGQRGYTIIVSMPSRRPRSSAMASAGSFLWDWPTLSRGGLMAESSAAPVEAPARDVPAVVLRPLFSEHCSFPLFPPAGPVPSIPNGSDPGNLADLRGRVMRLLEASGGSMPLGHIPSGYHRMFGRHLYLSDYGECRLINLVKRMEELVEITGHGNEKLVSLRRRPDRPPPNGDVPHGGTGAAADARVCPNGGGRGEALEGFKRDLQDILVSYSCRIFTTGLEAVYLQRYKKALEYPRFGVGGLDELLELAGDVVAVKVEPTSRRKFLVARGQ